MKKKLKTLIYCDRHYLANLIFSGLKSKDIDIIAVKGRLISNTSTINSIYKAVFRRRIIAWLFLICYSILRRISLRSNDYDELMVVGIEDLSDLFPVYKKFYKVGNLYFWQWNPQPIGRLKSFDYIVRVFLLKLMGFKIATFDVNDAANNNLMFHPQIYSKEIVSKFGENNNSYKRKAVFLGMNKGRAGKLSILANMLNDLDIETSFKIVDPNPSVQTKELTAINIVDKPEHYEKYLEDIKFANILVEINQQGQQGLTLRTLETIFFGKKLITDNFSIIDYDFYNKNNIYIIDFSKPHKELVIELSEFATEDYLPIEPALLEKYDVSSLLKSFRDW